MVKFYLTKRRASMSRRKGQRVVMMKQMTGRVVFRLKNTK